jgi:hypothetical protein
MFYEPIFLNDDNEVASSVTGDSDMSRKRNFRLPKLEMKLFDGDFRNWIRFWGQF